MKTMMDVSLENTEELKNMLCRHPDLPLMIFAADNDCTGGCVYNMLPVQRIEVNSLILYDNMYLDKSDYAEELQYELEDSPDYRDMTDKEFDDMIETLVEKDSDKFVKCIVVYVGY